MSDWKVTWFDDDDTLRENLIPATDAYNVVHMATAQGVSAGTIIKIERVPT